MRSTAVKRLWPALTIVLLMGLVVSGIVLGTHHQGHQARNLAGSPASESVSGSGKDDLAVFSTAKEASPEVRRAPNAGAGPSGQATGAAEKKNDLAAQQLAAEAAAQRAAQEAALSEKQHELELKTAEQAAREKQLEQEKIRLEVDKQKALEAALEAEKMKEQVAAKRQPVAYSGPSSGTIVWQGAVKGTTLVTINGNASDVGQIVSGALPGVLVMIQPADAKHVGVASVPAPSNLYQRLTLRVQGNGELQESIRWSIP